MNDAIVISYDPFAMESRVTVVRENSNEQMNVASNMEDLTENLVNLAYKYNIYTVKTHAPLAITAEIKRNIAMLENKNYSKNKIIVEGI